MSVSYFVLYEGRAADAEALRLAFTARFADALGALPGVGTVRLYSPAASHDPFLEDEPGPALLVRASFASPAALEAALASGRAGLDLGALPGFAGRVRHQAMQDNRIPRDGDPAAAAEPGAVSYFVFYQGPAPDDERFRRHYLTDHTPLLARLPGLRAQIIYTPLAWSSPLALEDARQILVCDVSFDSAAALDSALASDVRKELREDYKRFPPMGPEPVHQAMVQHAC